MIVQCPECSSQYRVADEDVPESGGKIECSTCNNVFLVHPDGSSTPARALEKRDTAEGPVADPFGSAGGGDSPDDEVPATGADDAPELAAKSGREEESSGEPRTETSPQTAAGGVEGVPAGYDGPWKVKSAGLTYEFPDTEALNDWRSDRTQSADYQVSADGSHFFAPAKIPQLDEDAFGGGSGPREPARAPNSAGESAVESPSSTETSGPAEASVESIESVEAPDPSGAGSTGERISRDSFELPSEKEKWNSVLYGILAVLLLIAGGIALQIAGVVELRRIVPGASSPPAEKSADEEAESESPLPETPGADLLPADTSEEELANRSIRDARDALEKNRYKTAMKRLETAELYAPERAEVYELMARTHDQLGQPEPAARARERARDLRSEAARVDGTGPPSGSGAGE